MRHYFLRASRQQTRFFRVGFLRTEANRTYRIFLITQFIVSIFFKGIEHMV